VVVLPSCGVVAALFLGSCLRRPASGSTSFPYTTLFRSARAVPLLEQGLLAGVGNVERVDQGRRSRHDRPQQALELAAQALRTRRSEEHTSELQSRENLVCRLLLEKKKQHRQSSRVLSIF